MIRPSDLQNRQTVHQPRPFDLNEPSLIAPTPEPGDDAPAVADPLEHAERDDLPTPTDEDVDE